MTICCKTRKWLSGLIALIVILCFSACGKSESEAYRQLAQATTVDEIDRYLEEYDDAPMAHIDSAKIIRKTIYDDSLTYKNITETSDVVERYELCLSYAKDYPHGLHLKQVNALIAKDKKAALQQMKSTQLRTDSLRMVFQEEAAKQAELQKKEYANKKYANLRNMFSKFCFIKDGDSVDAEVVILSPPDDNGEGHGMIANIIYQKAFTYTVYSDRELHLQFSSGRKSILTVWDSMIDIETDGVEVTYYKSLQ